MRIWRDLGAVVLSIVTNLIADELRDWAPRLARRIVRWSAHRSFAGDVRFAELREVELVAVIDRCPPSMKPLAAIGLVFVLVAKAGRGRVGPFACGLALSIRGQSAAVVAKSYATTSQVCRAEFLRGYLTATAKVVVMRQVTFRTVAIALFVSALLIGDLAGATAVQLMPNGPGAV